MTIERSTKFLLHFKTLRWSFLLLIPFETPYLAKIEIVDNIFFYLKILFAVIVISMVTRAGIKKKAPAVWLFSFYQGILLLSTILNSGAVVAQGFNALITCCFVLFFDYMMNKDSKSGIRALMFSFELLIYINFVLLLVYPKGIALQGGRGVWLFGQANDSTLYINNAFLFAMLYLHYIARNKVSKIRSFVLIFVCIISTVLTGSATSIVGLVPIILFLCIYKMWGINVNPFVGIGASAGIFFLFVILRAQEVFAYLIEVLLHRSLTFSNRLRLWDMAILWISKKPVLGYGVEARIELSNRFMGFGTPHNKILYTAYQGGVVLVIVFVIIIIYAAIKTKKYSGKNAAIVITAFSFAYLIQMQFESYTVITFWIPFLCGLYIDKILKLRWDDYAGKTRNAVFK